MRNQQVLLRCGSCRTVNRLPSERLMDRPKCGKCKGLLDFPKTPVEVTASNFEEEVLGWPGHVLVEFWSPQCSICLSMMPFLGRLARERAGALKVALVDVSKEWTLSNRFDVRGTPVFIVYRNGTKVDELYGAMPRLQMEAWIESAISG